MTFKLLVVVLLIKTAAARINIDYNQEKEENLSYSGTETYLITDEDIRTFKIGTQYLRTALDKFIGHRPNFIDLKKEFNMYGLAPVRRVLSIKSAKVINLTKHPVVVMTQASENRSKHTIKANAGISHSVANTLTTSWEKEKEFEVSQDFNYGVNFAFLNLGGTTTFAYTNTWGNGEEKSITETIGTTSNMEVELKPGEAVRAVLSAYKGVLEIEIVYKVSLTGCIYYKWQGDEWIMAIDSVMSAGGIKNEVTTKETITFNYCVDSNLKVYDTNTGLLLL